MKKYPTYRLVFDRRKYASKNKKGSVELGVLFQGKRKWFKTGVNVYKNQWSDKARVKASVQMFDLNERLYVILSKATDYIINLILTNAVVDMRRIDEAVFLGESKNGMRFVEFVYTVKNLVELQLVPIRRNFE